MVNVPPRSGAAAHAPSAVCRAGRGAHAEPLPRAPGLTALVVAAPVLATLVLATLVLIAAAWLRGAEYDEQYTLFLTAGTARPTWPDQVFPAGRIAAIQAGHASLTAIARDLRATDVHPPLYFWAVSIWRGFAGPGLFAARLFSVGCGLASLAAVAVIARRCRIRSWLAILLTLGSYGFVYTTVVARGFAPAQTLMLCGIMLLAGREAPLMAEREAPLSPRRSGPLSPGRPGPMRTLLAGVLFGAACGCNYLAVFVCAAAGLLAADWLLLAGALPFLALDAWFFAAQHGARDGQFPPFSLLPALQRLAGYEVASVFGGLPLYFEGRTRFLAGAAVGFLALGLAVGVVSRAGSPSADRIKRTLLAAAVAPPVGLLLLGAVFNNTPIELRYLSFGTPYIALLSAWVLDPAPPCRVLDIVATLARAAAPRPMRAKAGWAKALWAKARGAKGAWSKALLVLVLSVQTAAILGLMFAAPTMQPARATAAAAARLAGYSGAGDSVTENGVVLLPRGNDGVGIVGAFGLEAPAALPILLVSPADTRARLRARVAFYHRIVLALLAEDGDSAASLPAMRAAFAAPGWRRVATGFNVEAYERTADAE